MTEKIDFELVKYMDGFRRDLESVKATLAVLAQNVIDLRNDLNDFKGDMLAYRALRAEAEIKELEQRRSSTENRIQTLKLGGSTDERIAKAVDSAMKKRSIDWMQVGQVTVQAVVAALSVGVVGILFWKVIGVLAAHAP